MFNISARVAAQFKETKPPPGYVPGLGRGAVGFVTRSDIGSAGAPMAAGGGGGGRGSGEVPGAGRDSDALFGNTPYDADDAEADREYKAVDDRLESRGKRRREEMEASEAKRARMTHSRIGDTFDDVKQELSTVSEAEWDAIPDIGDRSLRYKKKAEKYTPVTDALIDMDRRRASGADTVAYLDPAAAGGASTPGAGLTDIRGLSEARGQMLTLKLDSMSDSVTGQTVIDPKGYLTSMTAQGGSLPPDADIGDVKKSELLLKSIITANPTHGPGWIAAARLQEHVRNLAAARKLIRQGCDHCPGDEDVWMEAARMSTPQQARIVLADAVKHLPTSVKLWLRACDLEQDVASKKVVLRKALTLIPGSEKLWKAAVSLEPPEDARIMLARAVECVSLSVDLWLALARLETYENAQKVLNQARAALPSEPTIWIAAAKLEEAQGHVDMVERIIVKGLKSLASKQVMIDREAWLKWADEAERSEAPATATAIVTATAEVGVDEVDRRRTWLADAAAMEERGSMVSARAMYARLLAAFPDKEAIWMRACQLEKKHGTAAQLEAVLQRAVAAVPHAAVLWLMWAKESWLAGNVEAARAILGKAFAANPNSEAIWLAAAKLEWETGEIERARALLARARANAPTDRAWMKSAGLEREVGAVAEEERLLLEGVTKFPSAWKLWAMLGQLYDRVGRHAAASDAYHAGIRVCPTSTVLRIAAARLEERLHGVVRARTVLETARFALPRNPALWLESVRLERRAGNEKLAENVMAKALQECPTSGVLWAEDMLTAPRMDQRRKSKDAMAKCDNDPHVVLAVARLFWADRKYDKARKWFNRAVTLDPDLGDAWIHWYAFELVHGTKDTMEAVAARCGKAEPSHGERWQAVAKRVENRTLSKVDVLKLAVVEMRREAVSADLFGQRPAALGLDADVAGVVGVPSAGASIAVPTSSGNGGGGGDGALDGATTAPTRPGSRDADATEAAGGSSRPTAIAAGGAGARMDDD